MRRLAAARYTLGRPGRCTYGRRRALLRLTCRRYGCVVLPEPRVSLPKSVAFADLDDVLRTLLTADNTAVLSGHRHPSQMADRQRSAR